MAAAVCALALLPGSSAATRKRTEAAPAAPEIARTSEPSREAARVAPVLASPASLAPAAFFINPPIATYAADCTTAKDSFSLGEEVCIKVSDAPVSGAAVVLSDPDSFTRDVPLPITDNSQNFSFTLPSASTTGGVDNRGAWMVAVVNTSDNSRRAVAKFFVHDPQQPVADVTISKITLDTVQAVAGGNTSFRVYVTNQGPDPASNVTFADNTLPNTTFVSFTQDSGPTFNCTPPAVNTFGSTTCTRATMAVGDAASFTAVYKVNTAVGNNVDLTDTVGVTSATTDSHPTSNNSTVETTSSNPTPPACTISCPANITVTASPGQNGAAVTYDAPATTGTCPGVTTDHPSGSFFPVGTTLVTASAGSGVSCSFFVTVNQAVDTTDPSITCPADITVSESSAAANSATVSYSVTAADDSGNVAVNCDPDSGDVFPVGTTEVRCTATDPAGNSASCTFNVTVTQIGCDLDANSAPPVPNVASLPTITRTCSVSLLPTDDPAATDACGGTVIGQVTAVNGVPSNDRTYDVPGDYVVTWTYTDTAGHTATQNQTFTIPPDTSAPVPNAASLPTATGECSVTVTPPTATDNCAGEINGTTTDPLTYIAVGTYTVHWKFTDAAGNDAFQNQTVVVTDTHAPVVSLVGAATATVECHTGYTDAGVNVTDNCSATPTASITSNDVDVNTPGTYHVVWSATDAGGNTGSATRTVVVEDHTIPVITLNGANPMTVLLNSTFTDPGATATDSCAGQFAATPSGSVNTNVIGTYVITYNATDPAGNAAVPVTRTVHVVFNFSGFFSPVSNLPTINQVTAGRSVPVKFSLAGNQGLGVVAAGSPYSQQVTCGSANISDLQETGTAGSSSLSYDASTDRYNYVWKTESAWVGTCRVLTVKLIDGTEHQAYFKFK